MKEGHEMGTVLTFIFVAALTIAKTLGLSSSSKVYVAIFSFGLILGLFKIVKEKFSRREIALLLPIVILGVLCFVIGKETTLLFTSLVLLTLKGVDIKRLIKIIFWIKILLFAAIILLTIAGYLEDCTVSMWRNGQEIIRHSLIYGHPNIAHLNLALILILWTYIYYEKVNLVSELILGVINFAFYYYTFSRTGLLIGMICIALAFFYKKAKCLRNFLLNRANLLFIVASAITVIAALLYGKFDFMMRIDELFTSRIYYNNYFLTNIPMPLIGKSNYGGLMIDNGFISILYNGGILAYLWFAMMNIRTGNLLKENKFEKEVLLMTVFCIYSLTESFYMNAIINVSLLFFSWYIFDNKQNGKRKKQYASSYLNSYL